MNPKIRTLYRLLLTSLTLCHVTADSATAPQRPPHTSWSHSTTRYKTNPNSSVTQFFYRLMQIKPESIRRNPPTSPFEVSITESPQHLSTTKYGTFPKVLCHYDVRRKDCGYPGISPGECLKRGCCWDHRSKDTVWCFVPIGRQSSSIGKGGNSTGFASARSGDDEAGNQLTTSIVPTSALQTVVSATSTNTSGTLPPQQNSTFSPDEQRFLSQVHHKYRALQKKRISYPPLTTAKTLSPQMSNFIRRRDPPRPPPQQSATIQTSAHNRNETAAGYFRSTTTTPLPFILNSIKNLKNFASLLSFLERIEESRKKKLTPAESPQVCSISNKDTCCRMDPTSPCCEFKKERSAIVRSSPAFRIVGGSPAGMLRHSVAHIAKLPHRNHICGGTLISGRWVLTAAHCVLAYCHRLRPIAELVVSLGKYRKSPYARDVGQQNKYVNDVICHPNQCKSSPAVPRLNDVALIRLERPAIINQFVRPAILPTPQEEPLPFRNCFTLGWGRTRGSGFDNVLKQVSVPVIPNRQCNLPGWRNCVIRSCMLCAGDINIDPCDGDSGGPLFCSRPNGVFVLHGVYSWGRCGVDVRKPSVYSRAPYFIEWIDKVTRVYSRLRF